MLSCTGAIDAFFLNIETLFELNSRTIMTPYFFKILVILSIVFLSACINPRVDSDVSVFHKMPTQSGGLTYAFSPLAGQEGNLEFESYSKRIAAHLLKYNYLEVPLDAHPDLFLSFRYGIGDGETTVGSMPLYGKTGGGNSYTSGTVQTNAGSGTYTANTSSPNTYGIVGSVPVRRTNYPRELTLTLFKSADELDGEPEAVYQASVISVGAAPQINAVMDEMLDSLFEEFPGESGVTRSESRPFVE